MTALTRAINQGHWRQAKLLIDAGSDVNWRGKNNRTPLMEVCFLDNEDKATSLGKMLLENGARLGLRDDSGLMAVSYSILLKRDRLFHLFTECVDFDLNSTDHEGNTALFHAVTVGNVQVTQSLVAKLRHYGLTVDTFNLKGETPLLHALKLGHLECANILIEDGNASMEIRDVEQRKSAREFRHELQNGRKRGVPSAFTRLLDQHRAKDKKPRRKLRNSYSANDRSSGVTLPDISHGNNDKNNNNNNSNNNNCRSKTRPFTAPERILVPDFFKICTPIQEDLLKLYSIYHQQKTASYRKGYKPLPFRRLPPLPESREESNYDGNAGGTDSGDDVTSLARVGQQVSGVIRGAGKLKAKRGQGTTRSTSSSPASQSSAGKAEDRATPKKTGRGWPKPLKKGLKAIISQKIQGTRNQPPDPAKSPP